MLTKPGEVGEVFALYWLKSLSTDYKAKLFALFPFARHSFLTNNLRFNLVKEVFACIF
jgi:hypothetical protein